MIYVVATPTSESNYDGVVGLGGVDFGLRLLWNERDNHWFMSLSDSSGDDIVTGIKVVANTPFAIHCADSRMPSGAIWIIDTTLREEDPGLRDIGSRCVVLYADRPTP